MSRLTLKMVCSGSLKARCAGRAADEHRAVVVEADDARHQGRAGFVADDDRLAVAHVGGEAEGGAEIDADDGRRWHSRGYSGFTSKANWEK